MTLTPERIAEIAAEIHVFGKQCGDRWISSAELAELCRLARLGLRVDGATSKEIIAGMFKQNSRITVSVPDEWIGKRVALVVTDA